MRVAAGKNFYLRLTVEKMHAFAVFNDKYLRSNGCSDTNFTATIKCTNLKTEIQSEMNKTQIIGINISFVIKLELKVIKQSFYHLSIEKLFCTGKIILL